jgi:hypothetical protein
LHGFSSVLEAVLHVPLLSVWISATAIVHNPILPRISQRICDEGGYLSISALMSCQRIAFEFKSERYEIGVQSIGFPASVEFLESVLSRGAQILQIRRLNFEFENIFGALLE